MVISREEAAGEGRGVGGGYKMNEREVDLLECGATPHILHLARHCENIWNLIK